MKAKKNKCNMMEGNYGEKETYVMFLPNGIKVNVTRNRPSDQALLNFLEICEKTIKRLGINGESCGE